MTFPVMNITLVDENFFPFVGSVVTCNSESTEIALGCPASLVDSGVGICPYSPTITFGPSTYALTYTNTGPYAMGGVSAKSCNATLSTPLWCTEIHQQSTFAFGTYSSSIHASNDLETVPVTITAGAEKLCSPLPGFSSGSGSNSPAAASGSTTAASSSSSASVSVLTVTISAIPSQTSTKSSGSSTFFRNSSVGWFRYMLPAALMLYTQMATLY